jgi:hypothetical protein
MAGDKAGAAQRRLQQALDCDVVLTCLMFISACTLSSKLVLVKGSEIPSQPFVVPSTEVLRAFLLDPRTMARVLLAVLAMMALLAGCTSAARFGKLPLRCHRWWVAFPNSSQCIAADFARCTKPCPDSYLLAICPFRKRRSPQAAAGPGQCDQPHRGCPKRDRCRPQRHCGCTERHCGRAPQRRRC